MAGISSKALAFGEPKNKEETFQGQRFDDELGLNWVQFKWRNHDPQIGRFVEIDPLAEDYVYNSPYAFSENKVIRHVELEGLESADSQDPRVRALMKDNVQQKMQGATNTLKNAAGVEVTAGAGVGVKAGVGPVKVEAGVSGPQAKVSVNVGGEVSANGSAASAGVKVGTPVGDAKAGGSLGNVKLEDGRVTTTIIDGGASAKPSASVSKGFSDGKTSGEVSADTGGEISAGIKIGIGIAVKLNPLNLIKGFAKFLDAATSYKVEEFKEKSKNPMINRNVNHGPN